MARKTKVPAGSPALWPLEADQLELEEYVTSRVHGTSIGGWRVEPARFAEAFDASWPTAIAEAANSEF